MSHISYETIIAEMDALKADIAANPDPRSVKLALLSSVAKLYAPIVAPKDDSSRTPTDDSAAPMPPQKASKASRSRLRAAVLDRVNLHLRQMNSEAPIKTAEIYAAIKGDIEVDWNDPVSTLSAIMNQSGLFVSHGRGGWTLPPRPPLPMPDWTSSAALFENAHGEGE